MATQEKQKRGFKFIYKAGNGSQRKKEFEPDVMVDKKPILLSWISRKSKTCPDNKTSGRRSRLEADVGGGGGMVEARKSVSHIDTHLIEARKSMFHIEPNMVEARKSVSHINTNLVEARKSVSQMETNSASVIAFLQVKVMVSDMPSFMQVHAFRCARQTFDSLEKFSPKHMAFNMKKEFDKVYGPAWHCIVGSSFGSFVTHSTGCFLYFSMEKLYILLFKTKIRKAVD